ncbi:Uncharacterised protein [Escherichia coli]|uniref:Ash family protein n=1 Tax=Escherichia coli TaxID=562 RepID=A0A377D240_ECOLX|nr:Uncharacterised protein [Escherichia coli]
MATRRASAAICISVPRAAATACCARYTAALARAVAICVPLSCASASATSLRAAVTSPAVADTAPEAILPKYRATPTATSAPAAVATLSILPATPFSTPESVFVTPLASFAPPTQAIKAFSTFVILPETVSGMAAYSSRNTPSWLINAGTTLSAVSFPSSAIAFRSLRATPHPRSKRADHPVAIFVNSIKFFATQYTLCQCLAELGDHRTGFRNSSP